MLHLYFGILLISWLQRGILCDEPCGNNLTVFGAEGGDVILPVKTEIIDVSWVTVNGGNHFVSTKPDGYVDIRDNSRYRGRLYGTADGSLNITNLTKEDQREYRANIRREPGSTCNLYNLTVLRRLSDEDIEITNVTRNGSCAVTFFCAVKGSSVTISWSRSDGREITGSDGFLNVTEYKVNLSITCIAENPVSVISKTVTLRKDCLEGPGASPVRTAGVAAVAAAVFVTCVVLAGIACWIHIRRKRQTVSPETATVYEQVTKPHTQNSNAYEDNAEFKQTKTEVNTFYSEVLLPKKLSTEGGKTNGLGARSRNGEIHTLYSEVQHIKKPQHKKEEPGTAAVYDTVKK